MICWEMRHFFFIFQNEVKPTIATLQMSTRQYFFPVSPFGSDLPFLQLFLLFLCFQSSGTRIFYLSILHFIFYIFILYLLLLYAWYHKNVIIKHLIIMKFLSNFIIICMLQFYLYFYMVKYLLRKNVPFF